MKRMLRKALSSVLSASGLLKFSWRILMYHRVIDPEEAALPLEPGMYVRPETFRIQMRYLAKHCHVIPLDILLADVAQGKSIAPQTVAITFDDGWEDTYRLAYPILQEFGLPATIFLPTAYIGEERLFWTDELALRLQRESPRSIASELPEQCGLLEALSILKAVGNQRRAEIFTSPQETPRQFLTWDEVRSMERMSFGSHSHEHCFMNELSKEALQSDYTQSMDILEKKGAPHLTKCFCYPNGELSGHSQDTLMHLGVPYALTTERGIKPFSKPLLFPRVGIHQDVSYTPSLFAVRICFW